MNKGYLAIVLHAHLPYVHHPEHDSFFEENWLFEAITECYLPLIAMLERLRHDQIRYRLTLSLSPTLITMLQDELLQTRYLRHLNRLLELAEKEVDRTVDQPEFHDLARRYHNDFTEALHCYRDRYRCDLLEALAQHQRSGDLELITTAATHGFLPLLNNFVRDRMWAKTREHRATTLSPQVTHQNPVSAYCRETFISLILLGRVCSLPQPGKYV